MTKGLVWVFEVLVVHHAIGRWRKLAHGLACVGRESPVYQGLGKPDGEQEFLLGERVSFILTMRLVCI